MTAHSHLLFPWLQFGVNLCVEQVDGAPSFDSWMLATNVCRHWDLHILWGAHVGDWSGRTGNELWRVLRIYILSRPKEAARRKV